MNVLTADILDNIFFYLFVISTTISLSFIFFLIKKLKNSHVENKKIKQQNIAKMDLLIKEQKIYHKKTEKEKLVNV